MGTHSCKAPAWWFTSFTGTQHAGKLVPADREYTDTYTDYDPKDGSLKGLKSFILFAFNPLRG